jgi:co-chaperonin GroES (HSP10)
MRPIGKYIVINSIDEEIETSSGLLLSTKDQEDLRYKRGVVVEVGTDVDVISKGDKIQYDKRAGHTMSISGVQHTVIREVDVVVVE